MKKPDVTITDHGTLWTFTLRTDAAREWADMNVSVEPYLRTSTGFHADHRPAHDIAHGMMADGLTVERVQ